jgi:hypothetical protein
VQEAVAIHAIDILTIWTLKSHQFIACCCRGPQEKHRVIADKHNNTCRHLEEMTNVESISYVVVAVEGLTMPDDDDTTGCATLPVAPAV